jgi:hypothetical protein
MDGKPFRRFLTTPQEFEETTVKVERILWESFADDRKNSRIHVPITRDETKRRFKIVERWFGIMRGDMHFSNIKTMDLLPRALRAEIDGTDFVPPTGAWAAPMEPEFLTDEEVRLIREHELAKKE